MKKFFWAALALTGILMSGCTANAEEITFHDEPTPSIQQTIYLWDSDNIPAQTVWTNSNPNGDPEDFVPNMISVPVAEGVAVKGAMMINPGGAFLFRGYNEGIPVAKELSKLGYQCFVVNYRLNPYTQEEAALDLARGIRYVRKHANDYGIEPSDIGVMGFSAGGILSGELALNFNGYVNGTILDDDYVVDDLDMVSADVAAVGLVYSFYGRLSVAELDVDTLREGNLPPTYVLYGSNEVFRSQIERHVVALREAGVTVEDRMLDGYSHGFAANGDWFGEYDDFLTKVFEETSYDSDVIKIEQPIIEGNKAKYSITADKDISTANVITALYDNGVLTAVRINTLSGEFEVDINKQYVMKVFVWDKQSQKPLTDSIKFDVPEKKTTMNYEYLTTNSTIGDLLNHPAFDGFAEHMLPYDGVTYNENMPLSNMSSLMVYHTHVNPENSVAAINRLIDDANAGKQIFYDFYTDEEKAADPSKKDTGLFFYRGEIDKPFAVQCAGGAFSYVGTLHESMPHCVEVNKQGYNAFAIKYRVGGEQYAAEDLAAAISFIIENADELGVSPDDYSVWGGSAGARMAADMGSYGTAYWGGSVDSRPATVVMAYTGRSQYTQDDPPTYVIVGENDGIANHNTMKQRVDALSALGIDTEFRLCENLGHGFGIGLGTTAEGWIEDAVKFWEKHIQ